MPDLRLQSIKISRGRPRKETRPANGHNGGGNGHLGLKNIKWEEMGYREMVALVEKLVGPRPTVPENIDAQEWSPQAIRVLNERYFLKDEDGRVMEDARGMCWRVAWELARAEVKYGKTRKEIEIEAKEFYKLMINRWFLPNSPTLMNAGKGNGLQYSACYVIPVPDSLEGIFDGVKWQGIVHQSGGGTGFSFSRLRPKGSRVKSSMGTASGPVSFMRIYNKATQQIKQGGTRRGANMGILRVDHPDVMEFIHCKDDGVGITNFNISVAITDEFMTAVEKDEEYTLYAPQTDEKGTQRVEAGKLRARDVWNEIAESAWKTGDPGMIFLDRMNQGTGNPIRAEGWEIESTNPCVAGDALVSTKGGLVKMEDLFKIGKPVEILVDGRLGREVWSQVGRIVRTGKKQVFRLVTEEGYELRLTKDHKVRTGKGWVEAGQLVEGDRLWISNRKGGFGKEGSLELGQVLGWLVGDGTMKATEAVLSFFGQEKQELAPRFAQYVTDLTEGMQKLNRSYPVGVGWIDNRDEARVRSARLWRLAEGYGITHGDKLKVPEKIWGGTEEMQRGFLQALFTADGHVSGTTEKGVSVRLTSTSHGMLVDVQRLLLNFGIASQIYSSRRKAGWRMMPDGNGGKKDYLCRAYHDLVIAKDNLWRFAEEIGFLVDYKNAGLVDRLRDYKEGPYKESFLATFAGLAEEDVEWVYDLTEPITHSFVANGMVVHNCGEQPLYPFDACNLGSIFLNYYVGADKKIDWEKLGETVHTAVRMLDNVIEMNPFPLPQIAQTVRKIRRIGLGVGGWADMLVKLGIAYDSEEALGLGGKIMKFINEEGHRASQQLARERGAFPMWKQSIYADDKPMRNSTVTTIAPTGSISILADTSSGIEPLFAICYRHIVKVENRELAFVNPLFEQAARERGFYSQEMMDKVAGHGTVREIKEIPEEVRRVFGTAHEIHPDWHVKMQAVFQKYTDNAVSKTINLPNEATVANVKRVYNLAWETGCQGITVFRDGCKSEQVLNLGTNTAVRVEPAPQTDQIIKPRPVKVEGATYRIETPLGSAFITVNHDGMGNPFEVFVAVGKAGSEVAAMAEAIGRLISTTLRFGNHMPAKERARELMEQLQGIGGGRSVGFGPNKVRSLPDAVARAIGMHFGLLGYQERGSQTEAGTTQANLFSGEAGENDRAQMALPVNRKADICPSCGEGTLTYEEGCKKCYGCGYSEC